MEVVRSLVAPCGPGFLFAHVEDLDRYPEWMELIHEVEREGDDDVWNVELQARVGPFARSKRLRMRRTVHDVPTTVVFERDEADGRSHSPWTLRADVTAVDAERSELTMTLVYGGSLWTGAVLQRVLDEKVSAGSSELLARITAAPRH